MKNAFTIILALGFAINIFAKNKTVTGTVTEEQTGNPLSGVVVMVKNTTVQTLTDDLGKYTITLPDTSNTLTFSYPNMRVRELAVNNKNSIDVKMTSVESEVFMLSLEELMSVKITTQKREEDLQDVPLSVTAIQANELHLNHVSDMSMLDMTVPGLSFHRNGSDARPSIRGVTTRQMEANGDPTIGFFIDGIYQSRTSNGMYPFYDVSRIEVQRGPQGTFYGRNTLGGNICVISNSPTDKYSMEINNEFGNYNSYKFDGFVNAPISETVFARVAWFYENHDGYIKNLYPQGKSAFDQNQGSLRTTLKIAPSEKFSILFRSNLWKKGGNGLGPWGPNTLGTQRDKSTGIVSMYGTVIDPEPPVTPIDMDGDGVNDRLPNPEPVDEMRLNRNMKQKGEQILSDVELSYDFGGAELKSITAYNDYYMLRTHDPDFSELDEYYEEFKTISKTFTQEIHLSSKKQKPFDWIVGAFFFSEDISEIWDFQYIPAPEFGIKRDVEATTKSIAAFGQIAYSLDKLRFILGGRFTQDDKTYKRLA